MLAKGVERERADENERRGEEETGGGGGQYKRRRWSVSVPSVA